MAVIFNTVITEFQLHFPGIVTFEETPTEELMSRNYISQRIELSVHSSHLDYRYNQFTTRIRHYLCILRYVLLAIDLHINRNEMLIDIFCFKTNTFYIVCNHFLVHTASCVEKTF